MARKLPPHLAQLISGANSRGSVISMQELVAIESRLGVTFRDKHYLEQAFIHRSYGNEAQLHGLESNERQEFLGDCVIEFVVGEYLFRHYPTTEEGKLTAYRSALVNMTMLARIVDELGLGQSLRMSRGEKLFFDRNTRSTIRLKADLFEAIVGAIYLDRGVGTVELFLNEVLISKLKGIIEQKLYLDAKSHFQELAQEKYQLTPSYEVLDDTGPDHDKNWLIGVFLGDRIVARGWGSNKPEAETEAAREALKTEFGVELEMGKTGKSK